MAFTVYPAIDLKQGRCVRLRQGRMDDATIYAEDPSGVAERFAKAGARWLHLVDLDGAVQGRPQNQEAIRRILEAAPSLQVQLGGGLRSMQAIEEALAMGIARVILGSIAAKDPAFVREACRAFPGKIAVGIDAKDGQVAVQGWTQAMHLAAEELAMRLADAGVAVLIHTDIARDGMLTGPNLKAAVAVAKASGLGVIVSGGVASIDDVRAAAALQSEGIVGVVIGKALYEGRIALAEALQLEGDSRC